MRQQIATTRDAVPSQQSKHETGMTDVLKVLKSQARGPFRIDERSDEESKMDTQTMEREEPRSQHQTSV